MIDDAAKLLPHDAATSSGAAPTVTSASALTALTQKSSNGKPSLLSSLFEALKTESLLRLVFVFVVGDRFALRRRRCAQIERATFGDKPARCGNAPAAA